MLRFIGGIVLMLVFVQGVFSQEVTGTHDIQPGSEPNEYNIKTSIKGLNGVDIARIKYVIDKNHTYKPSATNALFSDRNDSYIKFYIMAVPPSGELNVELGVVLGSGGEFAFQVEFQYSRNEEKTVVNLPRLYLSSGEALASETEETAVVVEPTEPTPVETPAVKEESATQAELEAAEEAAFAIAVKEAEVKAEQEAAAKAAEEAKVAEKLALETKAKEEASQIAAAEAKASEEAAAKLLAEETKVKEEEKVAEEARIAKELADQQMAADNKAKEEEEIAKAAEVETAQIEADEAKAAAARIAAEETKAKQEAAATAEAERIAEEMKVKEEEAAAGKVAEAAKAAEEKAAQIAAEEEAAAETKVKEEEAAARLASEEEATKKEEANQKAAEEEAKIKAAQAKIDAEKSRPEPEPVDVTSTSGKYTIQLLSLSKFSQARLNTYIKEHKLTASKVHKKQSGDWMKITYGEANSIEEAKTLRNKLVRENGIEDSFVTRKR